MAWGQTKSLSYLSMHNFVKKLKKTICLLSRLLITSKRTKLMIMFQFSNLSCILFLKVTRSIKKLFAVVLLCIIEVYKSNPFF
jgi:hypothetical protein